MLRNKSVIMKIVDDKNLGAEIKESEPPDYEQIIQEATTSVIMILGFYFVADTVRQLILR